MSTVPSDTGIEVGRSTAADAVLTVALLVVVLGLGIAAEAQPESIALVAGGALTLFAEAVAGRYRRRVRSLWARQPVRLVAILGALAAVTAGALLAPDRSVSVAVGALGTYLLLLWLVSTGIVRPPGRPADRGDGRD